MHRNNFDFIRLVCALTVVVSHSYSLSGMVTPNWLFSPRTDFNISAAQIALRCLFVISGYLIFQSLTTSRSLVDYFRKRVLRIFPALYVVLSLTVFAALFLYNGTVQQFINNPSAWTYLPNNLFLVNLQWSISGVFENNPYSSTINGSLWTIPYELFFYIVLCPLFFLRNNVMMLKTILMLLFIYSFTGPLILKEQVTSSQFILNGKYVLDFGACYVSGSLLAVYKIEKSRYLKAILGMGVALTIFAWHFSILSLFYFTIPITVIPLALASTKYLNSVRKSIGDLSYGIYIYSFPVQQTLMHYFKFNYLELMISSIIISVFFGYLSWHLIERKALKFKTLSGYRKLNMAANYIPGETSQS